MVHEGPIARLAGGLNQRSVSNGDGGVDRGGGEGVQASHGIEDGWC